MSQNNSVGTGSQAGSSGGDFHFDAAFFLVAPFGHICFGHDSFLDAPGVSGNGSDDGHLQLSVALSQSGSLNAVQSGQNVFVAVAGSCGADVHDDIFVSSVDLLTYSYELNKEMILPETKQRHDAIIELGTLVPDFDFHIAMEWLMLNRYLNRSMLDGDGQDNPYKDFIDTIKAIKEEHGDDVLQKVFDIGADIVVQPIELVEVAKYVADDGEIDRIEELLDDDFFLTPYEEHKQGGMNLC